MSNHGSTIRRRTLRVALIGGAVAPISSPGLGHTFHVGPWPGDWTGPFPPTFNGPFPDGFNGPFPGQLNGPFPAFFNGPFPDNSTDASAAPEDTWSNGNPASSLSDDWKASASPNSADDSADDSAGGSGGEATGSSGCLGFGGGKACGGRQGRSSGRSGGPLDKNTHGPS